MSTGNAHDPAKTAKLAQQIVATLLDEDSVTRQRAIQAAMLLLGETVPQAEGSNPAGQPNAAGGRMDMASFFNRDGELKPADYAYLSAAYHFSQFGTAPFSLAEIREIAADAGVVLPDRLDMTFSTAAKRGKKLFQSAGKGSFRPTAAGSLEFGERWGAKPGRMAKTSPT